MRPYRVFRIISPELAPIIDEVMPPPTDPWYFRTSRGGVYRAVPPFTRVIVEHPHQGRPEMVVIDRCANARYLRPGTREYEHARWRVA